jgi:hypothetical protein
MGERLDAQLTAMRRSLYKDTFHGPDSKHSEKNPRVSSNAGGDNNVATPQDGMRLRSGTVLLVDGTSGKTKQDNGMAAKCVTLRDTLPNAESGRPLSLELGSGANLVYLEDASKWVSHAP